jgi:hypothetical protein
MRCRNVWDFLRRVATERKRRIGGRDRRGFALIMAISLIILAGAALVTMSAGVVAEVKKTRSDAVEAQLRELLIAGSAAARGAVTAAGPKAPAAPMAVAVPADLTIEAAALKLTPVQADGKLEITVEARFANRRANQILTYTRQGEVWKLTDARLD